MVQKVNSPKTLYGKGNIEQCSADKHLLIEFMIIENETVVKKRKDFVHQDWTYQHGSTLLPYQIFVPKNQTQPSTIDKQVKSTKTLTTETLIEGT